MDLGVDFYDLVKCIVLKRGAWKKQDSRTIAKNVMREKWKAKCNEYIFL